MNKILLILFLLPLSLFGQGNFFWSHTKAKGEAIVYELNLPGDGAMDLWFKPDGTKLFILTKSLSSGPSKVYEYSLNTAWDISTYTQSNVWNISPTDNVPHSLFISPDGLKLFFSSSYSDAVKQYNLSSAFSISNPLYAGSFYLPSEVHYPTGLFFKNDGTWMYVSGISSNNGDVVYTYELSTPWNVTTASFISGSYNNTFQKIYESDASLYDIAFNSDGSKSYVLTFSPGYVFEYSVSPAWFPFFGNDNEINLNSRGTRGMYISPDNSNLYVIGTGYGFTSVFIKKFDL